MFIASFNKLAGSKMDTLFGVFSGFNEGKSSRGGGKGDCQSKVPADLYFIVIGSFSTCEPLAV